jgi:hypothetical protein
MACKRLVKNGKDKITKQEKQKTLIFSMISYLILIPKSGTFKKGVMDWVKQH